MVNAQPSTIAVIELSAIDNRIKVSLHAKALTSNLMTQLPNKRILNYRFYVVERSSVDKIIRELGLQTPKEVNACAIEIGKLLGVDKIITGEYAHKTVNIRLVDVKSEIIEKAITIKGKNSQKTNAKKVVKKLGK